MQEGATPFLNSTHHDCFQELNLPLYELHTGNNPNCRQPSPGELCNLRSCCSRRKGCHPLITLKVQFLLVEADFPSTPPTAGAGSRCRSSGCCGMALGGSREAVPMAMEAPQSQILFPRQGKTQPSRTSCCRAPWFSEEKFPSRSLMKCCNSDGSQPPACAP